MDMENLRLTLDVKQPWQERSDGWWLEDAALDVQQAARMLCAAEARLATITAVPAAGGECRLAYHWDVGGRLLTMVTLTHGHSIPSIASICPAADWIEREIHDYFAIAFTGRADLPPLVLRENDPAGLFNWPANRGSGA